MQNKLISIVVGVVLVAGMGSLVYAQKQAKGYPLENNTTQSTELGDKPKITDSTSPVNLNTNLNTTKKPESKYESESDDDEDEEEGDDDDNGSTVSTTPITTTPTKIPTSTTTSGISLSTISSHNSRASCWSAINGSVYDLTSWVPNHPGGEQTILSLCGKDGSAGYNGQHGSSSRPAGILAGFKIGTFAK